MTKMVKLRSVDRRVSLKDVGEFSARASTMAEELRDQILAPRPRKGAPVFTTSEVAELCGMDRSKIHYLASREGNALPPGEASGTGRSRIFTLAEARQYVQQASSIPQTSLVTGTGAPRGRVLLTSNFKGGSTKTTTCMCVAQGLTLRGRKVLVVDLDPQASLSELCGLYAEKEVKAESTVLPFIYDPSIEGGLSNVIQETYWDGLDVIPAHSDLFDAEFFLPSQLIEHPDYRFWEVLRKGLEPLRSQYDYILLDTAPSLSYMTVNALLAADAMLMPLVPESLDFVSSISFWNLFSGIAESFLRFEENKAYDFISVVLSKVDNGPTSSAPVVRAWVQQAYGPWLNTIEIPESSVMSSGALALATVFDLNRGDANAKTVQRIKQPLMDLCKWIDDQYVQQWSFEQ